jgi:hypothetical protein
MTNKYSHLSKAIPQITTCVGKSCPWDMFGNGLKIKGKSGSDGKCWETRPATEVSPGATQCLHVEEESSQKERK